tara:strand:- start:352 stop:561 length:210 start_codon:yes stop_codon:yes gene_type:complete
MGAWSIVESSYKDELASLTRAIQRYATGDVKLADDEGRVHPRALWEKALYDENWNLTEHVVVNKIWPQF